MDKIGCVLNVICAIGLDTSLSLSFAIAVTSSRLFATLPASSAHFPHAALAPPLHFSSSSESFASCKKSKRRFSLSIVDAKKAAGAVLAALVIPRPKEGWVVGLAENREL